MAKVSAHGATEVGHWIKGKDHYLLRSDGVLLHKKTGGAWKKHTKIIKGASLSAVQRAFTEHRFKTIKSPVKGNPKGVYTRLKIGDVVQVEPFGSGVLSGEMATVVPKFNWRLEEGAYQPVPRGYVYLKSRFTGKLFTMPLNRLRKRISPASSSANPKPSKALKPSKLWIKRQKGIWSALNMAGIRKKDIYNNPVSGPPDLRCAEELELWITNTASLIRVYEAIAKNLVTKMARSTFDAKKAVKAFLNLADEGARHYGREIDGKRGIPSYMNRNTRLVAAGALLEYFIREAEIGNYDLYLPKKYQKTPLKKVVGGRKAVANPLCTGYTLWNVKRKARRNPAPKFSDFKVTRKGSYYVAIQESRRGPWVHKHVFGSPVKVPGFTSIDLFVHKPLTMSRGALIVGTGWRVSEGITGARVTSIFMRKKDALKEARLKLRDQSTNKKKLQNHIMSVVDLFGITPRYKKVGNPLTMKFRSTKSNVKTAIRRFVRSNSNADAARALPHMIIQYFVVYRGKTAERASDMSEKVQSRFRRGMDRFSPELWDKLAANPGRVTPVRSVGRVSPRRPKQTYKKRVKKGGFKAILKKEMRKPRGEPLFNMRRPKGRIRANMGI